MSRELAKDGSLAPFTISTGAPFPEKGPGKSVLHDKGALKVQSIMLGAGQRIPPCAMEHDVLFYVVKGASTLVVDGNLTELVTGTGVVVPKEAESREMYAHEELTILAVQGVPERESFINCHNSRTFTFAG